MLSAVLRRKVFEPLCAIKSGSPKLRYWKELERTQYLPEAILRERQWKRVTNMLEFVYENNHFYRKRFQGARITPQDIRTPYDLTRIPILTKQEIRRNAMTMISRELETKALFKFKTGGSTGIPLELYITEECSEIRNACARRHDRWTGWEVGEPIAAVWGNPKLPVTIKDKLKNWLLCPTIYLDTMNVTGGAVRVFAREWRKVKPTLLFGHAHSLYLLAQYVRDLALSEIQPKGILSTSMMLLPHERALIEKVFGVKVFDRYGCEEVSLIASECESHQGLHLNIEHLFIEFLKNDGTEAKPGEEGQIVVTDLMNRAMPFIRYRVEDVGVPSEKTCSCGKGLPLMERVTGRVADFLVREDGSRVAGVSLIENTLTRIPGIEQMQIVQESINHLEVRIVPGGDFAEGVLADLKTYFIGVFGGNARILFSLMDDIPSEQSGKYRFSICNVETDHA